MPLSWRRAQTPAAVPSRRQKSNFSASCIPRGFPTLELITPAALQQFDEYQALSVQQRNPGDPRSLYQLSQGPNPVSYNVAANGSALYVGANYGSRNVA